MKTDDRDERLASILDDAVRDMGVDAREAPAAGISGIGRPARLIAAAAAAAVFVAGVVFASGQFGRDSRPGDDGTDTIVEGSLEIDGWQLERPSDWFTSPFEGCKTTLPRGLIVSNVEFDFLNPQGQIPSCGERMVFAGFPSDGVAIDLEPEGVRWGISYFPFSDTPFPIRPSQLVKTSGISGGPHEAINLVAVEGEPIAMVRLWVGPDASAGDVDAAHRILDSMRIEGADRWVDAVFDDHPVRVSVSRPEDWVFNTFEHLGVADAPDPVLSLTSPAAKHASRICGPRVIFAPGKLSPIGAAILISDASGSWTPPEVGPMPDVLGPATATSDRTIECRTRTFRHLHFGFEVDGKPILVDVLMGSSAIEHPSPVVWSILESLRFPKTPTPDQPAELPPPVRDFRSEFVSDQRGYRVWPTSGRVEQGVTYRFDAPHCGLDWLVDFDGSFWEPTYPVGDKPDYAFNSDAGTMTLVGPAEARYVASDGSQVSVLRIDGPVVTHLCA